MAYNLLCMDILMRTGELPWLRKAMDGQQGQGGPGSGHSRSAVAERLWPLPKTAFFLDVLANAGPNGLQSGQFMGCGMPP